MFRRTNPFDEMWDVFRSFDRAFGDLGRRMLEDSRALPQPAAGQRLLPGPANPGLAPVWSSWGGDFVPAVDWFTRDGNLVVRVELPGVDPKDVEVSVTGDELAIRGEKKLTRRSDEGSVQFQEVAHGRFERTFTLPAGVKTDQVKATCANGVLEVVMPAEGLPEPRRIPVETTGSERKTVKAA